MSEDVVSPDDLIQSVDRKITAIRTKSNDFSFNELADMYESEELIIDPEFQRMFRWTEGAQSRFIESLLLELPVPPIFLIEREDRVYELIDGLQRISSFLHFRGELSVEGTLLEPLVLSDCDIVPELNGHTYSSLPRALEIKLKRSYIRAEILRKESDPRLRYYMFKRLNTGGEQLSKQEVRNATIRLLSNDFNQFIIELARNRNFSYCVETITEKARAERFDHELVLRFFTFKNVGATYKHDIADFLTDYMEAVSDPSGLVQFDFAHEREVFEKTFEVLHKVGEATGFGPRIMGTVSKKGDPRWQFSVYHFEGIALGLQRVIDQIDPSNGDHITSLASVVKKGKSDPEFLQATGGGKNDRISLQVRVGYFSDRFAEALA
ncbi:GmrSD restriction endonuclease domain-containing protein [Streptomyces sp. NPDC001221]